jgi:hypothetical protein
MADWFTQNAPKPAAPAAPVAGDWFASNAPKPAAPAPSWLDSVGTFLDRATKPFQPREINKTVQAVNPLLMTGEKSFGEVAGSEGLGAALSQYRPIAAVGNVLKAQGRLAEDAQKDFEAGRYGEGVVKALHYVLPMLGPGLQNAGEELQRGEVAAGLGDTAGIAAGIVGPAVAGRVVRGVADAAQAARARGGVRVTPKVGALNPAEAEAVAFARSNPYGVEVPVDAATATGNRFIKGADVAAESGTLAGSMIAEKARAAQQRGLATLGEQIAAKGYPKAVTKEAAGEGLDTAIRGVAREHGADASYAYKTLEAYEADPSKARSFTLARNPDPVTGAPREAASFFAPRGAPKAAVFDAVYTDAVKQGWKGTKKELRAAFDERVMQAKDLGGELASVASEYSDEALLQAVRSGPGLRPSLKEGANGSLVRGDFAPLVDSFRTGKWRQAGGASIFRKDGLPLDELVQQLNADPRFADLTPSGLMERLSNIAAKGPSKPVADLEGLLSAVDVRPGARWWDRSSVAADQAIAGDIGAVLEGKHLVRTETVPLGVDLRGGKQGLQPIYAQLKREGELAPLMGAKADALRVLDRLMTAPDVAPLSVVDGALGELKGALRKGRRAGEFLSDGQGATAQIVRELDDAVQAAAKEAGPEVHEALMSGRASTIAKYDALDVLDLLNAEPVKTVNALTAPKGGGIAKLREVARIAPKEMAKVGRSWLDEQLGTATEAGGFAHADKLYANWQKLDAPTKRILFGDAGYVKDLDNFFLLAKKLSDNPNPSGSARVGATVGHLATGGAAAASGNVPMLAAQLGYELTGAAVAKLVHSRRGVQLLTQGLRIPVPSVSSGVQSAAVAAARAKVVGDLARFAGPEWYRNPVFSDEDARSQR